jgi:hypothetical protein
LFISGLLFLTGKPIFGHEGLTRKEFFAKFAFSPALHPQCDASVTLFA